MAVCKSKEFSQIPIAALKCKTRCTISHKLNGLKIIPSPSGLPRDWRGLAHIAGTPLPPANSCDPTSIILEKWGNTKATFAELIEALKELDRWDVLYDILPSIENDADIFANSTECDNKIVPINKDEDNHILTIDDVRLTQSGMEPQSYDAFLLYSDDDVDFAMQMVDKLENHYNLKLCLKDRDLVGGISFEHEAIMRLISERCNRLIIIVSPSFLNSPANKFFVTFAQAIGIRQGQRKIIPCIYKRFQLPQQLSYYYVLDYARKSQVWDFWTILYKSVVSIPTINMPATSQKAISIKELPKEEPQLAIDYRKPENWDSPMKSNEQKPTVVEQSSLSTEQDECNVKLKAIVEATTKSSSKSSSLSLFKKVLPKSLKEKRFKKSKKKVALSA